MINFKRSINYSSLIFLVAFVMLILSGTLRMTMFVPQYRMIARMCTLFDYLPLLLVTAKVLLLDKLANRKKMVFVLLGLILLYSSYVSKYHDLTNSYFMIWGSLGVSLKRIFKTSFFTMLSVLVLTVLGSLLGLIPDLIYLRDGNFRIAAGTIYPTIFASMVFFTMVAYLCWQFKTTNKKVIMAGFGAMALVGLIVYIITDTRNDFICIELLALVTLWRYYGKALKFNLVRMIILIMPTVVFLWTAVSAFFFNPSSMLWNFFNQLFSNRLSLVAYAANRYSVQLLGQSLVEHGNGYSLKPVRHYFFIDSSFSRVMLLNGVIAFIIVYLAIQVAFYLIISKKQVFLTAFLLIFVVTMIEGTFSTLFMTVAFNVTLFALKVLLPSKEKFGYD
ncbi:hypothetical protein M8332_00515 [Fructilactobacillus ixorae]|uniref:Polymerase n=1 Tax=Fructilactobacillus ixorae TaxID=1750535 RepID=A0ABY5C7Q3_9LACO|nr:hypothetical protein [Fructilactobacillus ixorae]USS93385.1 hypothetical protein M8332_00515 [Fructilactobacillus ixorae]